MLVVWYLLLPYDLFWPIRNRTEESRKLVKSKQGDIPFLAKGELHYQSWQQITAKSTT